MTLLDKAAIITVAAIVAFVVYKKAARSDELAAVPPCTNHAQLQEAHAKARSAYLMVLGKPDDPTATAKAVAVTDAFGALAQCEDAINHWMAPMPLKREALGLPPEEPHMAGN